MLLISDQHEDTREHVDSHEVPCSKADTYQLTHAIYEMWPPMAWYLVVILLAHFAAHVGVTELGAKELGYLQEREGEVGKMVVMHAAFVKVVIGNAYGINVLQLHTGPLLDVPVRQQSEGAVIEIPLHSIIELADHEPSTIKL